MLARTAAGHGIDHRHRRACQFVGTGVWCFVSLFSVSWAITLPLLVEHVVQPVHRGVALGVAEAQISAAQCECGRYCSIWVRLSYSRFRRCVGAGIRPACARTPANQFQFLTISGYGAIASWLGGERHQTEARCTTIASGATGNPRFGLRQA